VIRLIATAVLALLLTEITSCVGGTGTVGVSTGFASGPVAFGYGVNYFGPPVVYRGWGPGYFVGPPAWGGPRPWGGPRAVRGPVFRPAAPMRPMPTIPVGPRGPGMRGAVILR
jgi:hypothetical protein